MHHTIALLLAAVRKVRASCLPAHKAALVAELQAAQKRVTGLPNATLPSFCCSFLEALNITCGGLPSWLKNVKNKALWIKGVVCVVLLHILLDVWDCLRIVIRMCIFFLDVSWRFHSLKLIIVSLQSTSVVCNGLHIDLHPMKERGQLRNIFDFVSQEAVLIFACFCLLFPFFPQEVLFFVHFFVFFWQVNRQTTVFLFFPLWGPLPDTARWSSWATAWTTQWRWRAPRWVWPLALGRGSRWRARTWSWCGRICRRCLKGEDEKWKERVWKGEGRWWKLEGFLLY